MKKANILYDFEVTSEDKFKLELELRANGQLVDLVFKKSRAALIKKLRLQNPDFKISDLNKIDIDSRFLKSVKIGINSTLKKIYAEVKKDRIQVMHDDIIKAYFVKKPKRTFWYIYINLNGVYNDKRQYNNKSFY